ncbi:NADAR family protein [Parendozoicomonas haliclonae]|uniref:Uncharacterized protein n=1 Tax=Parendozoicomonas haliclonae TaxID=1960125 RepID=A0A1X7AE31_9GAMM|nr:NADAR family protein [Parendozoicomonas haliclonae]SMA33304.1 hypothetical protein EHSB41UT_00256 [Parendozoicomonas haliclonae]
MDDRLKAIFDAVDSQQLETEAMPEFYDADTTYKDGTDRRERERWNGVNASETDQTGSAEQTDAMRELTAEGYSSREHLGQGKYGRDVVAYRDSKGRDYSIRAIREGIMRPAYTNSRAHHDALYSNATQSADEFGDIEQANAEAMRNAGNLMESYEDNMNPYASRPGFQKSFRRGTDNMQAGLYGFANIMGNIFGSEDMESWSRRGIHRNITEAARNPATFNSFDDVDNWAEFGNYVIEALGENVPGLAADAVSLLGAGVTGGLSLSSIAGRRALGSFGKAYARSFGTKGITKMTGSEAFKKGFTRYGKPAAFGSMYAQLAGENQTSFMQDGIDAPFTALLAAIPQAALEYKSLDVALRGAAKALNMDVKGFDNILGQVASRIGVSSLSEGTTEAGQQLIQNVAAAIHDGRDPLSDSALAEYKEAAIKGGLVGGAIATPSEVVNQLADNHMKKLRAQTEAAANGDDPTEPTRKESPTEQLGFGFESRQEMLGTDQMGFDFSEPKPEQSNLDFGDTGHGGKPNHEIQPQIQGKLDFDAPDDLSDLPLFAESGSPAQAAANTEHEQDEQLPMFGSRGGVIRTPAINREEGRKRREAAKDKKAHDELFYEQPSLTDEFVGAEPQTATPEPDTPHKSQQSLFTPTGRVSKAAKQPTTAEPAKDIKAQLRALKSGKKPAVFLSKSNAKETKDLKAKGFLTRKTPTGTLVTRRQEVLDQYKKDLKKYGEDEANKRALGYQFSKQQVMEGMEQGDQPAVVVAQQDGAVIHEEAVPASQAEAVAEQVGLNFAGADVSITTPEQVQKRREDIRAETDPRLNSPTYRDHVGTVASEAKQEHAPKPKPKKGSKGVSEDDTLLQAIGKLGGIDRDTMEKPVADNMLAHVKGQSGYKPAGFYHRRSGSGLSMDDMGRTLAEHGYYDKDGSEYGANSLADAIMDEANGEPRYSRAKQNYSYLEQDVSSYVETNPKTAAILDAALRGVMLTPEQQSEVVRVLDAIDADPVLDTSNIEPSDVPTVSAELGVDLENEAAPVDWSEIERDIALLDAFEHELENTNEESRFQPFGEPPRATEGKSDSGTTPTGRDTVQETQGRKEKKGQQTLDGVFEPSEQPQSESTPQTQKPVVDVDSPQSDMVGFSHDAQGEYKAKDHKANKLRPWVAEQQSKQDQQDARKKALAKAAKNAERNNTESKAVGRVPEATQVGDSASGTSADSGAISGVVGGNRKRNSSQKAKKAEVARQNRNTEELKEDYGYEVTLENIQNAEELLSSGDTEVTKPLADRVATLTGYYGINKKDALRYAITEQILTNLREESNEVELIADADEEGVRSAWSLVEDDGFQNALDDPEQVPDYDQELNPYFNRTLSRYATSTYTDTLDFYEEWLAMVNPTWEAYREPTGRGGNKDELDDNGELKYPEFQLKVRRREFSNLREALNFISELDESGAFPDSEFSPERDGDKFHIKHTLVDAAARKNPMADQQTLRSIFYKSKNNARGAINTTVSAENGRRKTRGEPALTESDKEDLNINNVIWFDRVDPKTGEPKAGEPPVPLHAPSLTEGYRNITPMPEKTPLFERNMRGFLSAITDLTDRGFLPRNLLDDKGELRGTLVMNPTNQKENAYTVRKANREYRDSNLTDYDKRQKERHRERKQLRNVLDSGTSELSTLAELMTEYRRAARENHGELPPIVAEQYKVVRKALERFYALKETKKKGDQYLENARDRQIAKDGSFKEKEIAGNEGTSDQYFKDHLKAEQNPREFDEVTQSTTTTPISDGIGKAGKKEIDAVGGRTPQVISDPRASKETEDKLNETLRKRFTPTDRDADIDLTSKKGKGYLAKLRRDDRQAAESNAKFIAALQRLTEVPDSDSPSEKARKARRAKAVGKAIEARRRDAKKVEMQKAKGESIRRGETRKKIAKLLPQGEQLQMDLSVKGFKPKYDASQKTFGEHLADKHEIANRKAIRKAKIEEQRKAREYHKQAMIQTPLFDVVEDKPIPDAPKPKSKSEAVANWNPEGHDKDSYKKKDRLEDHEQEWLDNAGTGKNQEKLRRHTPDESVGRARKSREGEESNRKKYHQDRVKQSANFRGPQGREADQKSDAAKLRQRAWSALKDIYGGKDTDQVKVLGTISKLEKALAQTILKILKMKTKVVITDDWGTVSSMFTAEGDKSRTRPEAPTSQGRVFHDANRGFTVVYLRPRLATRQGRVDDRPINVWAGNRENAQFSNLTHRPFRYKGNNYYSVEHAYQTLKSGRFDPEVYRKYARETRSPIRGQHRAKTGGDYNLKLMDELVHESFKQNPNAARELVGTGDATFTHNRPDGRDTGVWAERFPESLTKARSELAKDSRFNPAKTDDVKGALNRAHILAHELAHVYVNDYLLNNVNPAQFQKLMRAYTKDRNSAGVKQWNNGRTFNPHTNKWSDDPWTDDAGRDEWLADKVAAEVIHMIRTGKRGGDKDNAKVFNALKSRLSAMFKAVADFIHRRFKRDQTVSETLDDLLDSHAEYKPESTRFEAAYSQTTQQFAQSPMAKGIADIVRGMMARLKAGTLFHPNEGLLGRMTTGDGQLRHLSKNLADLFFVGAGKAKTFREGWFNRRAKDRGMWEAQMQKLLNEFGVQEPNSLDILKALKKGETPELKNAARFNAAWKELQEAGEGADLSNVSEDAKKIRKFLDMFYDKYAKPNMPTLGRIKNYIPYYYKAPAIESRRKEFIEILKNHRFGSIEANELANKLIEGAGSFEENYGDLAETTSPSFTHNRERILRDPDLHKALLDAGFVVDNGAEVLAQYVHATTGRGSFENTMGGFHPYENWRETNDPEKNVNNLLHYLSVNTGKPFAGKTLEEKVDSLASKLGITLQGSTAAERVKDLGVKSGWVKYDPKAPDDLTVYSPNAKIRHEMESLSGNDRERAQAIVKGYLGRYQKEMPTNARKWQSRTMAYISYLTLAFSTVASIPDFGAIMIRARTAGGWPAVKAVTKTIMSYSDARERAQMMGFINSRMSQAALQEAYGISFADPLAKNSADLLFKMNGQEAYTNMTRIMANAVGEAVLRNNLDRIKHGTAKQKKIALEELDSLGIDKDTLDRWVKGGAPVWSPEKDTPLNTDAKQVNDALHQFVDEAVLRPNAAQRPVWANNPWFGLIWQLKSFSYAFGKVITEGIWTEMKKQYAHADGGAAKKTAAATLPLAYSLAVMAPFAALTLALREAITKEEEEERDEWQYMGELLSRSGMLGPLDLAMGTLGRWDQQGVGALSPGFSKAASIWEADGMAEHMNQMIPVLSQMPRWKDDVERAFPKG